MTLSDRIQLIEDMIRENPEYTIRDYLEMLKEFIKIEETTVIDIVNHDKKREAS